MRGLECHFGQFRTIRGNRQSTVKTGNANKCKFIGQKIVQLIAAFAILIRSKEREKKKIHRKSIGSIFAENTMIICLCNRVL